MRISTEWRILFKDTRAMERQKHNILDPSHAYQMMNDYRTKAYSLKNMKPEAGTLHTAAYFPKERKAWFAHWRRQAADYL